MRYEHDFECLRSPLGERLAALAALYLPGEHSSLENLFCASWHESTRSRRDRWPETGDAIMYNSSVLLTALFLCAFSPTQFTNHQLFSSLLEFQECPNLFPFSLQFLNWTRHIFVFSKFWIYRISLLRVLFSFKFVFLQSMTIQPANLSFWFFLQLNMPYDLINGWFPDFICPFQWDKDVLKSQTETKKSQWLQVYSPKAAIFCGQSWTNGYAQKNIFTDFTQSWPWFKCNRGK
jgi:hypothetical protein